MGNLFLDRFQSAPINPVPFQHLYVDGIFPVDFYGRMVDSLPTQSQMLPIGEVRGKAMKKYPQRYVFLFTWLKNLEPVRREFWRGFISDLTSKETMAGILGKFGIAEKPVWPDVHLIHDIEGYALGPHTDAKAKAASLLFYLPKEAGSEHLGTSLYTPKEEMPPSTEHFPFEKFSRVATMPYAPNAMFAFARSDSSFHGVEPVEKADRWLLQYNINAA